MITERLKKKLVSAQADWIKFASLLGSPYWAILAQYVYNHEMMMEDLAQLTLDDATIRFGEVGCSDDVTIMLSVCGFVDYLQDAYPNGKMTRPRHPHHLYRKNMDAIAAFVESLHGEKYPIPEGDIVSCFSRL